MTNLHWINSAETFNQICQMKKDRYALDEISERARNIHLLLWNNKDNIWFDDIPTDPVRMIDPVIAIQLLGFKCDEKPTLGQHFINGNQFEVAGVIDSRNKRVEISQQYDKEIRNFTAAHELGHAVLHRDSTLHRDRPLDGGTKISRNTTEYEADKFATAFLMPERLIRTKFKNVFLTDVFILNENTAFALGSTDYNAMRNKCKTLRQLSKTLASSEFYNGRHFVSLAKQFTVSVEAMAIRLEELGLVEGSAS
jgi:Zn-dependent peptidase ImmA (M78 family)